MLYGASRFLVEFLRINPRVLLGLSEAQLISSVMTIAGGAACCVHRSASAGITKSGSGMRKCNFTIVIAAAFTCLALLDGQDSSAAQDSLVRGSSPTMITIGASRIEVT